MSPIRRRKGARASLSSCSLQNGATAAAVWKVVGDGTTHEYPPAAQKAIEEAYQHQRPFVDITLSIDGNETTYKIEMEYHPAKFTQVNKITGYTRLVKRMDGTRRASITKMCDHVIKLLLVGAPAVGKTALMDRYVNDFWMDRKGRNMRTTHKMIKIDGKEVQLEIWDKGMSPKHMDYLREVQGILCVYDVTKSPSYDYLSKWMDKAEVKQALGPNVVKVLVGNKCDMEHQRTVDEEDGRSLAQKNGNISFYECSAKETINVRKPFETLARKVLIKIEAEALHSAAAKGDVAAVIRLVSAGKHVNKLNSAGYTPLHCAAENDEEEVARALVEAKASIEAKNNDGKTPLQLAGLLSKTKAVLGKAASKRKKRRVSTVKAVQAVNKLVIDCKDLDGAFRTIEDALVRTPDSPQLLKLKVKVAIPIIQQLLKSGDVLAAFRKIESGLEAKPDSPQLLRLKDKCVHATDEHGFTPLVHAFKSVLGAIPGNDGNDGKDGNMQRLYLKLVDRLLEAKARLNTEDIHGQVLLPVAVRTNNYGVIVRLLKAGAAVDAPLDELGMTTLMWSAMKGHVDLFDMCLRAGAKPDVMDSADKTPMSFAYERGHAEMISRLIDAGANPNVPLAGGLPILICAAVAGQHGMVKAMVDAVKSRGAEQLKQFVDFATAEEETALVHAFKHDSIDIFNTLLAAGADPNSKSKDTGTTAILWVVKHRTISSQVKEILLGQLIAAGAQLDVQDIVGKSALVYAYEGEHTDLLEQLVAAGANPNVHVSPGGLPILICATMAGQHDMVEAMVDAVKSRGAEQLKRFVDFATAEDETALVHAFKHGHIDIFNTLLAAGADPNYKDADSHGTALMWAITLETDDLSVDDKKVIIRRLSDAGAQVRAKDRNGITAKMLGEVSPNAKIRKLVKELGRFCNTYDLRDRPEHNTETSVVFLAEDLKGDEVAIKLMRNKDQYDLEMKGRENVSDKYVIPVLDHSESENLRDQFAAAAKKSGYEGYKYGIIMECADRNLAVIKLQERPTLRDIVIIARQIAECLRHLHRMGFIHGDLKFLNIVRTKANRYKVIDLDAAALIGLDDAGKKCSTGFNAPELARFLFRCRGARAPKAHPSLDVWSFGVILYELLTNLPLFVRNARDDNIEDMAIKRQLCVWQCPTTEILNKITDAQVEYDRGTKGVQADKKQNLATKEQLRPLRHLVEWCLQGEPGDRPTVSQLLEHVGLGGTVAVPPIPRLGDGRWWPRWHVFVSHMQIEANGEAVRLVEAFQSLGGTGWLDMHAEHLTADGMRHGVNNSEAFVLLLTSNVLTRWFCLLEILTAMRAGKPIIILCEGEERFYPWKFDEWRANKVWDKKQRAFVSANQNLEAWEPVELVNRTLWVNESAGKCQKDAPVVSQSVKGPYDAMAATDIGGGVNPCDVREMIEANREKMLIIRRRDFEVESLVRHIWAHKQIGRHLPDTIPPGTPFGDLRAAVLTIIFADGASSAGGGAEIASALKAGVEARQVQVTDDRIQASHTVVVFTGKTLSDGKTAAGIVKLLEEGHSRFVFLYCSAAKWDFDDKNRNKYKTIDRALNDNEAMAYRPAAPAHLRFEHEAMITEMLKRLSKHQPPGGRKKAKTDAATAVPNLLDQAAPVPLTDRDRRQTAQEEAAREAQRMAEEMATERVKAIQSSLQQQLQQRDQQLQQRDETIKDHQDQLKHQQEENKQLAAKLQSLMGLIAKSASNAKLQRLTGEPRMPTSPSVTDHMQRRVLSLLEVSLTGKKFTWKKTRDVTLRLRGKELSWWNYLKKNEVQSCVIPSSVNIIFVPQKNRVEVRSYGTQNIFLRLFFISAETAKIWQRYLEDARAVPDTNDSTSARSTPTPNNVFFNEIFTGHIRRASPVLNRHQSTPVLNRHQSIPVLNKNQSTPVLNRNQSTSW